MKANCYVIGHTLSPADKGLELRLRGHLNNACRGVYVVLPHLHPTKVGV